MRTTTKAIESMVGTTFTWTVRAAGALPEAGETPLVVVPGGPGLPHNYTRGLGALARPGRPVVFYDPIGSGRSTLHANGQGPRWDIAVPVDELRCVVEAAAPEGRCSVLGHSSGGWVALEALVEDEGLRSRVAKLVLASAPLDVPAYLASQAELIDTLGPLARRRLRKAPPSGSRRKRAYLRSYQEYLHRFACPPPWPVELVESSAGSNRDAYEALWGPSEVWATGAFSTWSCRDRVAVLTMPILLTSGRHDEVTPALVRHDQSLLPTARWELFDRSAHMPHLEEPTRYQEAVDAFLAE